MKSERWWVKERKSILIINNLFVKSTRASEREQIFKNNSKVIEKPFLQHGDRDSTAFQGLTLSKEFIEPSQHWATALALNKRTKINNSSMLKISRLIQLLSVTICSAWVDDAATLAFSLASDNLCILNRSKFPNVAKSINFSVAWKKELSQWRWMNGGLELKGF